MDIDLLAEVLKELNLYDELFEFMKSKDISSKSLKYMKTRHIDELFNGTRLSTKILFEHRLTEWQQRKKQDDKDEISMKISQKTCQAEKCQLLTIKHSSGISSSYHIANSDDLSKLTNRLMQLIQNGFDDILNKLKKTAEYHILNISEDNVYENLNQEQTQSSETINTEATSIISETEHTATEFVTSDAMPESNFLLDIKTSKPAQQIIKSNMLEPSFAQTNKRKWTLETEVKEILLMYKPGNAILKYHQNFGILNSKLRTDLVHIIVDHFIVNNEFVSVTQCRSLAEEIVELFPTECLETYFLQENKSVTPKGKLWNLFQNERRSQKKDSYGQYSKSNRLKMESICGHLKNIDDESYLLKKWNKTFHYRRYQLQSGHFANWKQYFDEYPFCKQQNYVLFIDADLSTLYPELTFDDELWEDLLNNFKIIFRNRITHPMSKQLLKELAATNETNTMSDYYAIKILQLLHAVLNTTTSGLEMAQRQFTVEVSDLSELKEIVIDRKKYCLDNNVQCKPYIAVVREHNTYAHYSVILDSTGFGCDNYKESLILCFKLYLFFDISYPPDSSRVWLFLQKYLFNKHSLISDSKVDAFINDIGSQRKVNLEIRM